MSAGLGPNPNWDSPKLRVGAGSFVTPVRIYDIDLVTGERTLLKNSPYWAATAAKTMWSGVTGRTETTAPGSRSR